MAVDTSRWPLASSAPGRLEGQSVSAALAGQSHAEWLRTGSQELLLAAAAPIVVAGQVRGAVVLEQAGDQLLDLRDRALHRLFNFTLWAIAVVVIFLFGFATWISVRIGRLRSAADSAVGNDGSIRLSMPESTSTDEIGALARGFERLLARLNEHSQYLRTLGGKLSHELRTPLTIVRSSLDNLESEGLREDQRKYVTRARDGAQRLQSILSALGAAARVEESIKQAERHSFDLRDLLATALGAYRDGFPDARFELDTPPEACFMRGAPDLIIQMLDKLIENAVDFCPQGGLISVALSRSSDHYELAVRNDGPPIPDAMLGRLFESLIEQRQGHDDKPHFGLGLYIVRLVAEFHGGRATAANAPQGGAVFTVMLPLI
jgi:signal transduction histidine kinase